MSAHTHIRYDFSGRDLTRLEEIREFAELIALDITCMDLDTGAGVEVHVRDSCGQRMSRTISDIDHSYKAAVNTIGSR